MLSLNKIQTIDALKGLKKLSDESIDCVLTSPPYWAMRDYQVRETKWKDGTTCALGLEPSVEIYINHLVSIFDEIMRVLKKTGTLWINLGDTYAGSWGNYAPNGIKSVQRAKTKSGERWRRRAYKDSKLRPPSSLPQTIQQKSLCLIPARFSLGMVNHGWILRNDIIWNKPNHLPSSVKDRFSCSWEHLFFFVKARKYYFDLDSVRVPHKSLQSRKTIVARKLKTRRGPHISGQRRCPNPGEPQSLHSNGKNPGDYWSVASETRRLGAIIGKSGIVKVPGGAGWTGHPPGGEARIIRELDSRWLSPGGKNPGDSWKITTKPFRGAHFAVFPEQLCEQPIKAGCPLFVCNTCGTPKLDQSRGGSSSSFNIRIRDVQKKRIKYQDRKASNAELGRYDEHHYTPKQGKKIVFGCDGNSGFSPGVVLDPFMGAGTTAVVARKLGRRFIGFELNPEYVKLARKRLSDLRSRPD